MPFSYHIDKERDILLILGVGMVTDTDVISMSRDISTDPHFHNDIRVLNDTSAVTDNQISSTGMKEVLGILKYSPLSRRAILLSNNPSNFGAARMFQTYTEIRGASSVRLFNERKKALDYLNEGVPPEKMME